MSDATGLPKALTVPISAADKLVANATGFVTSPSGVFQTAAALSPAAPVVYAKWAYDMIKGGVASLEDAKNAIGQRIAETLTKAIIKHDNGNPATVQQKDDLTQKLAEDAVNAAASLLGGKVAAKAAIKPVVDTINKTVAPVAPATAEALKQTVTTPPPQPKEQSASDIGKTAEIHGDLRASPVSSAGEVPKSQGSGGVQPQGEIQTPKPPQSVGPENVKPDDLQPALLIDGKPVTGGANHEEIFNNLPDDIKLDKGLDAFADDSKHVFVDKSGKVYTVNKLLMHLARKSLCTART